MNARFGFAAFAAVAALATASASQAQDIHLKYNDLDLSRPEQAKVLDQRIDTAAQDWCAGEVATGTVLQQSGCVGMVRKQLVAGLPASARSAYDTARANGSTAKGLDHGA